MFGGVIANRVKEAMKQKVKDAEERYREGNKAICEEADVKIQDINARASEEKRMLENSLVEGIIGK